MRKILACATVAVAAAAVTAPSAQAAVVAAE